MTEKAGGQGPQPVTGLALLRQPVEDRFIAKLPKPTKQQTEDCKTRPDGTRKIEPIKCSVCHTYHHPKVIHLDYVGHAATTARLLEADEQWLWEPLAFDEQGLPRLDSTGGLWIRLTVCGVTRLGYGHAEAKNNADAGARVKEVIGDAIRNAAMRFGWALELWHKGGDLFLPSVHEDAGGDAGAGGSERAGEGGQRSEPQQRHPADDKKPAYTDEQVQAWSAQIMSGKKTAKAAIAQIKTKYTITPEQIATLQKFEVTK